MFWQFRMGRKLTRIDENRGNRRMTSYTNSGMKASPYCSSSLSFKRMRRWSTEAAASMTENSRINMILETGQYEDSADKNYASSLHSIHKRSIAFEAMCRLSPDLLKKIIEWYTKNKNLQNLLESLITLKPPMHTLHLQSSCSTYCQC